MQLTAAKVGWVKAGLAARGRWNHAGLLPWVALLLVWFLWGSTYIGIRYAVETIPPLLMSGSRYLIAGIILMLLIVAGSRGLPNLTGRQVRTTFVAGVLLLLGGNGLLSFGEEHLQSGVAALLIATVPLIMIVETSLLVTKRLGARSAAAIALGTAGVVTLVGAPGGTMDYRAAIVVLVGASCWATGSVYMANADMPANPLVATGLEMLFGGAALMVVGLATGELHGFHVNQVSAASLKGWLWLIGPGALVGFSAYTYVLKQLPTNIVATYAYVNPVVAVMLGSALGDQPLSLGLLAGGAAVVGAVAVTLIGSSTRVERTVSLVETEAPVEVV